MARDGSAQRLWEATLGRLQIQVTRPTFDTWLRDTVALSFDGQQLVIGAPTTFACEWLEKRMCQLIESAVEAVAHQHIEVSFEICQKSNDALTASDPRSVEATSSPNPSPATPRVTTLQLNQRYTFDNFIVGASNQLAHAAAMSVAERPGGNYNPLFLYGGVGLGKTHLLQAIAHRVSALGGTTRYVSCEQFTNDFISAIRDRRTAEFRDSYRSVDVLLVDDIQFISGKEQTQEGFFHTFNALHNTGRQIVLTSDRHPSSLALLEERLSSRFEWGLTADIQIPDLETRLAILRFKASRLSTHVPDDVLYKLAHYAHNNIRLLEGGLNRVTAFADITQESVSLDLLSRALPASVTQSQSTPPTPDQIITSVTEHYGITSQVLLSSRRDTIAVSARHVAAYLLRERLNYSLSRIGSLLGGKNHATILYSIRKITEQLASDDHLRITVKTILGSLTK